MLSDQSPTLSLSDHELRFQRSLQKLDVPDW
jgi:hypothetical protein